MSEPTGPADPWREPYRPEQPLSAQPPEAPRGPDGRPAWSPGPGGTSRPGAPAPAAGWQTTPAAGQGWPGTPPYAAWGQPPAVDPGTAWIMGQEAQSARTNAVIALVVSCVALSFLTIFAVPSIVLSSMAVARVERDPAGARRLTLWAWIVLVGIVAVAVLTIGALIAFLVSSGYGDPGSLRAP